MLLSIIVPVYNTGAYLRTCLDSVVSQADGDDVELICVDDGSSDESPRLLDEYAAEYSCVRVIHKSNGGISSARNHGIRLARGKWVMFLDHDDLIARGAIEAIRNCAGAEADIVYFDFNEFEREPASFGQQSALPSEVVDISDMLGKLQEDCLNRFRANKPVLPLMRLVTPWAKLYRRSFLGDNDLQFSEEVRHAEDIIFNLESLDVARNAARVDFVVLHHRLFIKSEGHRFNPKKIEYCKGALQALASLLPRLHNRGPDWGELYDYRVLWELLYCVHLGPFHPDNPQRYRLRRAEFQKLIDDPLFRGIFERCRISRLPSRHLVLAFLIKYRLTAVLELARRARTL